MEMKENKGISLAGFVIAILAILLVVSVLACIYLIKNPTKEKVIIQNQEVVAQSNSSSTEVLEDEKTKKITEQKEQIEQNEKKENTYKNVSGTYKFETEFKTNAYGEVTDAGADFTLYLTADGMYYYNTAQDINDGHSGYYTISDNKITLHKLFLHGNDVALHIRDVNASGKEKSIDLIINEDGSITDNNSNEFSYGLKSATLTKKSNEANYDIAVEITRAVKEKWLYESYEGEIPENLLEYLD